MAINELIKTGEGYHLEFERSLDKSFPRTAVRADAKIFWNKERCKKPCDSLIIASRRIHWKNRNRDQTYRKGGEGTRKRKRNLFIWFVLSLLFFSVGWNPQIKLRGKSWVKSWVKIFF